MTIQKPIPTTQAERDAKQSALRGLKMKCPNCGTGPISQKYLKIENSCSICGEELFHHRADDGPAYLTILIVGHFLVLLGHLVYVKFSFSPIVLTTVFSILAITMSLFILPRMKGMIVGIQWAKRMHGFGKNPSK